jgi:hypothetical protein
MIYHNKLNQTAHYLLLHLWELFFWAFSINVVLYTWQVANPLPMGDCWFFIDTFVRKMYDGTLNITDFF